MVGRHRRFEVRSLALAALTLLLAAGVASAQIPVQIIHASPDPAVSVVDVYVDGTKVADDLPFKGATPFIDQFGVPVILVGPTSTVVVADAASVNASTPLVSRTLLLTAGQPTLIEFMGLQNPAGFDPNPNGKFTGLEIRVFEGYKPAAANPITAELMAVHASPDLGAVDLIVRLVHDQPGQGFPLFTNLQYGDMRPYLALQPSVATLDLVLSGTTTLVETWVATFGLVTGAGVVGHAGGLNNPPTGAQGLTLFGAVASGFVFELAQGSETGVGDSPTRVSAELGRAYPNPFNPRTVIPFTLHRDQRVKLEVFDLQGRLVRTLVDGSLSAGDYAIPFAPTDLASGAYRYRLRGDDTSQSGLMTLVK